MSVVVITVKEPGQSPINITTSCVFARTSFEQQMNAVPGTFEIWVRDRDQTLSFGTGWEVALTIDGLPMFGGYVTQVSMTHFVEAADTSDLPGYQLRAWVLRGSDYNIVFDKRVVRNTADYLHSIDIPTTTDDDILTQMIDDFADMSDFSTAGIVGTTTIAGGDILEQGQPLRKEFESLSLFSGSVWYIRGDKVVIYQPYEDVEKRWGFSDNPNNGAITASPAAYQGVTRGFREVEANEDGSFIVNDALVWGGSEWAGTAGGTVFARVQNATSQSTYGRWQMAETHFGDRKYAGQGQVDARADVIINGPPGANALGQTKGLRFSQWQFEFTWFSHQVPLLTGTPDHIVAGDLVTIVMDVFSVTKLLPLRSLRITFPDAFSGNPAGHTEADRVVEFHGTFGLQLSDPFTLWRYIMTNSDRVRNTTPVFVNSGSPSTFFGAFFSGAPTPSPNGSTTVFSVTFPYLPGSLQVYKNGLLMIPGVNYTESDPEASDFTFTVAPLTGDVLWVICYTSN